jgi:hypothetical protein
MPVLEVGVGDACSGSGSGRCCIEKLGMGLGRCPFWKWEMPDMEVGVGGAGYKDRKTATMGESSQHRRSRLWNEIDIPNKAVVPLWGVG